MSQVVKALGDLAKKAGLKAPWRVRSAWLCGDMLRSSPYSVPVLVVSHAPLPAGRGCRQRLRSPRGKPSSLGTGDQTASFMDVRASIS